MRSEYQAEVNRVKKLVEKHLYSFLPPTEVESHKLGKAMEYTLKLPGKRIRPVLLLLAYRAAGGVDEKEAVPYAVAVEYIHTYSLIHDDLPAMDDDDLRRGKAANHKVFGEAIAILAGDALLSGAFEVLHGDYLKQIGCGGELELRIRAGAAIAAASGGSGMVGGQTADTVAEGFGLSPSKAKNAAEWLEYIHPLKTGALIEAAVEAGALVGGSSGKCVDMLRMYGQSIGVAFQIVDDILDAEGETREIGKAAGKDKAVGKLTYPAVHGMEVSKVQVKELTEQAVAAIGKAKGLDARVDEFYIGILQEFALDLAARVK